MMTGSKEGTRLENTDSDFFTLTEDHSQLLFEQQNIRQDSCFSASEKRDEELRTKVDVAPMKLGVVEITPNQKLSKRLQRLANEIIEQLYVDEVIFAMDEVINLARDQVDVLITTQS